MYPAIHAADNGNKTAYWMAGSGQTVTYNQLNDDSNRAAQLFRQQGLMPADGIAILLDNDVNYLKIAWAAQRSGLYYTPVSTFFQPSEIEYILSNSDAKILITASKFIEKICLDTLPELIVYLIDGQSPRASNWHAAIELCPAQAIEDECEGAEMIYSSGTTGLPKGVRFPILKHPPGTVSALIQTRIKLHNINPETRYLSTAPLYHSAPLRYNMMVTRLGGTAVIMEKFDAERALRLIDQNQITHSQWVPTMFVRLLKLSQQVKNQYNVASLRYVIHAAAPCPVDVKLKMIDWFGPNLYEYYSGTEANGSTAIDTKEWLTHQGSVGRAIHGDLYILDEQQKILPAGEIGSVYFANGSDFSYYKDPEKTRQAKNDKGWSTLGDIGYLDEAGYLYLKDRKSFMIISGGVNIYPQETENTLVMHDKVIDAAVFGIPNDEFGEEVKAAIQLIEPGDASPLLAQQIIEFCRQRISPIKCPKSIDFVANLPRHPTGKLYKRLLKDQYWHAK